MTNTLTLETLIAKGACSEARVTFVQLFPNGADLTVETFVNVADQLDWDCAAQLLLSPRNRVKFKKLAADARVTYTAAYSAACDTYQFAFDTYTNAYDTYNFDRDAYNASCDARKAAHAARDALAASRATAFTELYIQQESETS